MKIGPNFGQSALNGIRSAQKKLNVALGQLSSGRKGLKEDPAGFAVAQGLSGQASALSTVNRGIRFSQSTFNVADGALASQTEDLQRLRELAVQASNGTLSNSDRSHLSQEFNQLKSNVNQVASQTNFNGQKLLDGSFSSNVQTGTNSSDQVQVDIDSTSTESLGISDSSISTQENAQNAIEEIDAALDQINSQRASLGAASNRLDSSYNANAVASENLQSAASQMNDVDYAEVMTTVALEKTKLEASARLVKIQNDISRAQTDALLERNTRGRGRSPF